MDRLSYDQLSEVAYRLNRLLASLDPESERKLHAAAPAVDAKRREVRARMDEMHQQRLERLGVMR